MISHLFTYSCRSIIVQNSFKEQSPEFTYFHKVLQIDVTAVSTCETASKLFPYNAIIYFH
ncbi:hypothetical protein HNQ00_003100 [Flavobacterium sp. 14A]|nr:hypothetical protein [Flavobacterium sp. 14A]